MNAGIWISSATKRLETAGIGTARLDSELLVADGLKKDRSWVTAHADTPLTTKLLTKLNRQLAQRLQHVPMAYIRGKTEFYAREFLVDERVLEPRPETETMITQALSVLDDKRNNPNTPWLVADIGTGSGAIAITIKLEHPEATVMATDISGDCLELARQNAKKHKADVTFHKGDLLEPIHSNRIMPLAAGLMILANLPYVPDSYKINEAALHEPRQAIYGGPDGLDVYRALFQQLASFGVRPCTVLTEALPVQHEKLSLIASSYGFRATKTADFIQTFTVTD